MADEIIRMEDIYADDIVGNINEVREARGTFESLDARLDNIDGNAPSPSTSDPAMDGTASPGSADTYSRGDHVHPTDMSRQAVIDSSHKLSSDLVDDTNNTHKFATAAQLQQISTNEANISSILDGTTVDSFKDVETALSGKQATLTTAQLAAVNSGIDSTKVAQIETNKNNILSVADQSTKYNIAQGRARTLDSVTSTVSGYTISFSGTSSGTSSFSFLNAFSPPKSGDYVWKYTNGVTIGGTPISVYVWDATANVGVPVTDIEGGLKVNLNSTHVYTLAFTLQANKVVSGDYSIMIISKDLWDKGFTDFQPYSMSNAEITAWILAHS